MGTYELAAELRRRGMELRLSKDRSRLGVGNGQASLLTPEIGHAIRENYDYLIRAELLKSAARNFRPRLTGEHRLHRPGPGSRRGLLPECRVRIRG